MESTVPTFYGLPSRPITVAAAGFAFTNDSTR